MKLKKGLIKIVGFFVIAGLCFTGGVIWNNSGDVEREPSITSDLISKKLITVSELVTVDYIYTNMGKFEDVSDFYGWEVPFTKKRFIVSYDGRIKAGIDMNKVRVEVKEDEIHISLPEPKIFAHVIDTSSLEIFDESSYVFNPLKLKDYTSFVDMEKLKIEKDAIDNGLYIEATEKAEESIENLIEVFNTTSEEYTVIFIH